MSGFFRLLPSIVTGPRLLKKAMISVPLFSAPTVYNCLINRWRIEDCGATRHRLSFRDYHHYARSGLSFNRSLQCIRGTAVFSVANPGVTGDIWRFCRVGSPPPIGYGARNHSMHSMHRAGVVKSAGPLSCGTRSTLLRAPCRSGCPCRHRQSLCRCVAAVGVIVARERRIIPARVADAVMNGVMPVVIVIGVLSVPATVVRL